MNALVDTTSKANLNGSGVDNNVGAEIIIGICFCESISNSGNSSELDIGEFIGTVTTNYLILNLSDCFELNFIIIGGREVVED
jgi:hypothetical protein